MLRRFEVGSRVYSSQYGSGEVIAVTGIGEAEKLTVRFEASGIHDLLPATCNLEVDESRQLPAQPAAGAYPVGRAVPAAGATLDEIREAIAEALREALGPPEVRMLDRWKGGTMILKPGKPGTKEKEIPLDDFFHKIVMVRDRLRVLEQKLNAHTGLSDADKVELQQYVTRIYGSLTTFNILFADRDDWFTGQRGEGA